jgi:hypothetical protein
MMPMMIGHHGPAVGTIEYKLQVYFLMTGFIGGIIFFSYLWIVMANAICFVPIVICVLFFIVGYIAYQVDMENYRERQQKKAAKKRTPMRPPAQPKPKRHPIMKKVKAPIVAPSEPEVPEAVAVEVLPEAPASENPTANDELIE